MDVFVEHNLFFDTVSLEIRTIGIRCVDMKSLWVTNLIKTINSMNARSRCAADAAMYLLQSILRRGFEFNLKLAA